jgi:hypothetical protein
MQTWRERRRTIEVPPDDDPTPLDHVDEALTALLRTPSAGEGTGTVST